MTENQSPIIIGCDHAAFAMKEKISGFLMEQGIEVKDVGTDSEASVDYPDFAIKVASAVDNKEFQRGILLCGTGIGMSIVANKYPGVRACLCWDLFTAAMSRKHNDANILVIGGRVTGDILALEIVKVWLNTPFEGGRHQRRLEKMNQISVGK